MQLPLFVISILEGITEFLPISSTGHLIIASKLMSINLEDPYIKFYLLFIQLGALIAGILLFSKRIITSKKLLGNLIVSFIPTAVIGFLLYKSFKHLLEGNMILLAMMLFSGGIIFIYLEWMMKKKILPEQEEFGRKEMTYLDALIIGCAQAVAIVPGVSRSGATIVAGILRGIKKSVIVEYTFLLALPTLGAAVVYDFYKSKEVFATVNSYQELLFGFLIAFFVGYVTLYFLRKYLPRISLHVFGWYRIALAVFVVYLFI